MKVMALKLSMNYVTVFYLQFFLQLYYFLIFTSVFLLIFVHPLLPVTIALVIQLSTFLLPYFQFQSVHKMRLYNIQFKCVFEHIHVLILKLLRFISCDCKGIIEPLTVRNFVMYYIKLMPNQQSTNKTINLKHLITIDPI